MHQQSERCPGPRQTRAHRDSQLVLVRRLHAGFTSGNFHGVPLRSLHSGLWCLGAREKLPISRRKSVSLFWNEGRQERGRSNTPTEGGEMEMPCVRRHVPWTDSGNRTVPQVLPTEALSPSTTDGHFQSLETDPSQPSPHLSPKTRIKNWVARHSNGALCVSPAGGQRPQPLAPSPQAIGATDPCATTGLPCSLPPLPSPSTCSVQVFRQSKCEGYGKDEKPKSH